MTNRDEILAEMHRALRSRRRRSLALRAGAAAVPALALAAAWAVMHGGAPAADPAPSSAPAYANFRLAALEPAGRVETVSDEELIELLGRAGRDAGYMRTRDRFVLSGELALGNKHFEDPANPATVWP